MKRMWKCRLCLLLALLMAALFLPQSLAVQEPPESPTDLTENTTPAAAPAPLQRNADPTTAYDKAEYSEADVKVINAIIENNGLKAQKNDPKNWDFANWTPTRPKQITRLGLHSKALTGSLDVRGLGKLTTLWCEANQLTDLELSNLTALTSLDCFNNQLTDLELSNLTALTSLDCSYNQLTELNVSGLTNLNNLYCSGNQLTSLNLTDLPKNIRVKCNGNELTNLTNPDGAALRVNTAPNGIARIFSYGRKENGAPASGLVRIEAYPQSGYVFKNWGNEETKNPLYFSFTQDKTVTPYFVEREGDPIYHAGDLAFLENLIQERQLDGKQGIRLGYPDTYDPAGWQDTPANKRMISLFLSDLNLTGELDVRSLTALEDLDCSRNQLTGLNVSGLTALTNLYCSGNQLTSLDVSGLTALTDLNCYNNQLTGLDVSGLTALTDLDCYNNQLTSLDVSGLTQLQRFACVANPLSSLKFPGGETIEINVIGSGQPWLESFDYNSGNPIGQYIAKPAPGYGGEWSDEHGCTIKNNMLSFNFENNGNIADVSATLTFKRNAPLSADPDKGEIKGENGLQQGGQVKKGDTVTFTAPPITTGAGKPYNNDIQYEPESWEVNPSGNFSSGYTQRFSTEGMALGNHTLTVTYRMQQYNGDTEKWEPVDEIVEKTLHFTLVEKITPGGDTPGGNTSGGGASGSGQSGNPSGSGTGASSANPGTGDAGYAWYVIGLALAGGALLLLTRKKKAD